MEAIKHIRKFILIEPELILDENENMRAFKSLRKLNYLNLHVSILNPISELFESFTELKSLRISNFNKNYPLGVFKCLKNSLIDLSVSYVRQFKPRLDNYGLGDLEKLKSIEIPHIMYLVLNEKVFDKLVDIEKLCLNTEIRKNVSQVRLRKHAKLKYLTIQNFCFNLIVDREIFSNLKNLRELNIFSNLIKIIPQDTFDDLIFLEILNLNYNQLSYFSFRIIRNLKRLKILDLKHNKLQSNCLFSNEIYSTADLVRLRKKAHRFLKQKRIDSTFF